MNDILLKAAFVLYLCSALLFCAAIIYRRNSWDRIARWLLKSGFALQSIMVAVRWYEAGRPPFASMFEALVLFGWAVVLVYIVFELVFKTRSLAIPVNVLAIAFLSAALPADSSIRPLVPALQSKWMSVHVITYFIGYGSLSIAFVLSGLYLLLSGREKNSRGILPVLDELTYKLIIFGFPFLTIGMTTGSIWANSAWGTYWNWDPKETCSLITWLVYAVYLHQRYLAGWKGRKAAYLSLLGFLATLFTFVGVNFILPGLHSYS
jgi:ABC-type transport system involved in cytochrome c biogenesis permease subunit